MKILFMILSQQQDYELIQKIIFFPHKFMKNHLLLHSQQQDYELIHKILFFSP
jgi:hypothetical protein